MAANRVDDAYERLLKAIASYNGGAGTGNTWGNMLTAALPAGNTDRTRNRTYAIEVMRDYGIPARTYIWIGGQFPPNHAQAGQNWCFAYGEAEWGAGVLFTSAREQTERFIAGRNRPNDVNYEENCP